MTVLHSRPESLSSGLMMGINLYRNKPGVLNKIQAQIAYLNVATVAIVETVVSSIFTLFSIFTLPFTPNYFDSNVTWLQSSAFSIIWSLADFIINLFCAFVVADEESAKEIARSGDLLSLPYNAVL